MIAFWQNLRHDQGDRMASSATRVFMVRHGATIVSAEDRFAGETDVALEGLREISHGRWEQMTRREVEEKFPEEAAEWERDPYTFAPLGGESGLAVIARALPVLVDLVRQHPGENILVVSHKATIRLLLSSLLGFDPRRYRDNLDQKPAALNIVDFKDASRARLALFNDTSHYDSAGKAIPKMSEAGLSKWWNSLTK